MTREELVEKMLAAYFTEAGQKSNLDRMSAALDVAIEEVRETIAAVMGECHHPLANSNGIANSVCSRLMKVKTPEERVEVREWIHDTSKCVVLLDGWNCRDSATFDKADKNKAEIYRLGLIAKLKEESK